MTRRTVVVVAAAALIAGVAACESSSGGGGGDNNLTIGLLLPESQTTRYESFDKPLFEAKIKQLCGREYTCKVIYKNANQDESKQKTDMDGVLAQSPDVVVLDPVNGESAGALVATAKAKDIPVVAYDRLIRNADLDAYVSFDNEAVGREQAKALIAKLKAEGKNTGKIVMLNGSTTDNNARQFHKGARSVFDAQRNYQTVPKPDLFVRDWRPENAQTDMAAQITALGKTGFVGVYAANDGLAGGAIAAMRAAGISPLPPVTGQDAELAAIQRIVSGEQYMSIFKSYKLEAERAAEIAFALAKGDEPPSLDAEVNNGKADVPSALLPVVVVTKENVKDTVVAEKLWKVREICTAEFTDECAGAGLKKS